MLPPESVQRNCSLGPALSALAFLLTTLGSGNRVKHLGAKVKEICRLFPMGAPILLPIRGVHSSAIWRRFIPTNLWSLLKKINELLVSRKVILPTNFTCSDVIAFVRAVACHGHALNLQPDTRRQQ